FLLSFFIGICRRDVSDLRCRPEEIAHPHECIKNRRKLSVPPLDKMILSRTIKNAHNKIGRRFSARQGLRAEQERRAPEGILIYTL
ncbi:MAG: hypothetical protein K2H09_05905, partial [Treponemataceae bacterium]|nr:hypothetical protein [Treponemataceae bacterium]